jgi:hypothetical protein
MAGSKAAGGRLPHRTTTIEDHPRRTGITPAGVPEFRLDSIVPVY